MSLDLSCDELMVMVLRPCGGGKSAYTYAVEGGYTGTEEEFGFRLAALLNEGITAAVDTHTNRITLSGALTPGTYSAYYELTKPDGTKSLVEIGDLILGDEAPETKTYTITWANYDGTVLETDTVTEGDTPTYDGATPTRAEDGQYTYTFDGWAPEVVAATADATYIATYTQTAQPDTTTYSIDTTYLVACSSGNTAATVEGGSAYTTTIIADEGYNLSAIRVKMGGVDITSAAVEGSTVTIENVTGDIAISCIGYKSGIRIYHGDGTEKTVAACEGTGFIPVKTGDVVYIKNVTVETNGNSGLAYYDAGKAYISGYYLGSNSVLGGAVNGEAASFNVTAANAAYIRLSALVIDSTSIITVNEQLT